MVGCCETHQLPRDELRRFVKETPFTSREVLKLWSRFARLDKDHSGRLSLQVLFSLMMCMSSHAGMVSGQKNKMSA